MEQKLEQQLENLIIGFSDYQIAYFPKSALDLHREILEIRYEGITEQSLTHERLLVLTKGKVSEIKIGKHIEIHYDYGDFRNDKEDGEPIQNHLTGTEEAVILVHSEFLTRPKGPHQTIKTIHIYE